MNIKWLFLVVLVMAGCRKHDDAPATASGGGSAATGNSTYANTYTGTIDTVTGCGGVCKQTVPVLADVERYDGDSIDVYMCRNHDCRVSIPDTTCSAVIHQNLPCYTRGGSVHIAYEPNAVVFINAFYAVYADPPANTVLLDNGYSTYRISTIAIR